LRHVYVEDDAIRFVGWQRSEKFHPRRECFHVIIVRTEQLTQGIANALVVINDGNKGRGITIRLEFSSYGTMLRIPLETSILGRDI